MIAQPCGLLNELLGPCHTRQLLQATWWQPTAVHTLHDHFGRLRVNLQTLSYDPQEVNIQMWMQMWMHFLHGDCLELVARKLPRLTWPL